MALNDDEHQQLLDLLTDTKKVAKQAVDGWAEALEKCEQFRAATKSCAETTQMAIERLQKQEALVDAALKWREDNPRSQSELRDLAVAADNYSKYLKERS